MRDQCAEASPPKFKLGQQMLSVQGDNGNWNYDQYMHGMYNGMEYMLSLIEKRDPVYRGAPACFLNSKEPPVENLRKANRMQFEK